MNAIDYTIVPAIIFSNTILVFFILSKNSKSSLFKSLASLIVFFTLWILFAFLSELVPTTDLKLLLSRLTYASIAIGVFAFLLFVHAFIRTKLNSLIIFFLVFYIGALVLLTIFTNTIIEGIIYSQDGFDIVFGNLYLAFLSLMFLAVYGIGKLIKHYFHSTGQEKEQLKYFLFGFSLFASTNIFVNVILRSIVNNDSYYRIGNYSIVFFVFFTSYAIIRHRLLNIKFIITRSFIYLFLTILIAVLFILTSLFLVHGATQYGFNQYFAWSIIALLIIFGVDPLKNWFARVTDNIFYKDKIDYTAELKQLSNLINTEIGLDPLIENFKKELAARLKLKKVDVLISVDEEKIYLPLEYYKQSSHLDEVFDSKKLPLYVNSHFIQYLRRDGAPIIADELERQIYELEDVKKAQELRLVMKDVHDLQAEAIFPIKKQNTMTGILLICEKVSKEGLSIEDITLLEVLTNQLAAALERSKLYQKVQDFNYKLREEVERATNIWKQKTLENEELVNIKSQFISVASHQMRTPISVVRNTMDMLIKEYLIHSKTDDLKTLQQRIDESAHLLKNAFLASDNLRNTVETILAASEMAGGGAFINITQIKTKEFFTERINRAQALLDSKTGNTIMLTSNLASNLPKICSQDLQKFTRIIDQVLMNAVLYTVEGTIHMEVKKRNDEFEIIIADTGIGIPEAEQKMMFQRFVRLQNAQRVIPDGTGLGLYLAKQYTKLMRGDITFHSQEGKGTTFTIHVPINFQYSA